MTDTNRRRNTRRWLAGGAAAAALLAAAATAPAAAGDGGGGGTSTALRHGTVTVKRDTWGSPNIYAGTTYGLFYGYGYAAAQDRLFQLDMARRGAEGTVAQVLGKDYADFDTSVRASVDTAQIRKQYARLSTRNRHILDGYAAGLNAWVDKALADPKQHLPKEYRDFGFRPNHWTGLDVAMVTVGTMDIRFSDNNSELDNLATLQQLQAKYGETRGKQLFDQLAPAVDPEAPSTISARDLTDGSGTWKASTAAGRNGLDLRGARATAPARPAAALPAGDHGAGRAAVDAELAALTGGTSQQQRQFSNIMLVGKKRAAGADSLLLNGPQFGWFNPSYVYEVGLHGAGFDLVGNTPFAYPVVLFGHNKDISWGATAGNGDTVDMYQEKLDPADPHRYWYRGAWHRMASREETVRVKGAADRTETVWSTVHGTVDRFDTAHHLAYSRKRSWTGHELSSLFAWVDSTRATDHAGWQRQAEKLAISINWYYADRKGNIGYFFAGHFPDRPAGQDRRLPADGTGAMEWHGIQPADRGNPHLYNPTEGYLANWNNSPAPGYPNSDFTAWGAADRVVLLQRQLAAKQHISKDDLWAMMKNGALSDVNAPFFRPLIDKLGAGLPAGSPERRALDALTSWDGRNEDANHDGRYDSAGTAVMQTFLTHALQDTLGKALPADVFAHYSANNYPTAQQPMITGSQSVSAGSRALYQALRGSEASVPQRADLLGGQTPRQVVARALKETAATLDSAYGKDSGWKAPVAKQVYSSDSYLGYPETDAAGTRTRPLFQNRGTENDLLAAAGGTITGEDVMPPGESAFTRLDGTPAKHSGDQLDLYTDWGRKPTFFTEDEVDAHLESTERLTY